MQNKQIKLKSSSEIVEIGASCWVEKLKAILGLKPINLIFNQVYGSARATSRLQFSRS